MTIRLNKAEVEELMKQDPAERNAGGFQGFLVSLQENLRANRGCLYLDETSLAKIRKYAFGYRNGGWQNRLRKIFERTLGPDLRVAA